MFGSIDQREVERLGKKKRRPGAAPRLCRCTNQSVFPGYLTKVPMEHAIQKNVQKKSPRIFTISGWQTLE
jgi:hypothetical protein